MQEARLGSSQHLFDERGDVQHQGNSLVAQLRRALAPVDGWLRTDAATAGFLDRIKAIKAAQAPAAPGQPIDCAKLTGGSAASADPAAAALDGNYTMSYTAQDMLKGGASADEVVPENWGDFRLVLGPDAVSVEPNTAPDADAELVLPAEAFVRLVYGRLDPGHTPPVEGDADLDELRAVFPGF